MRKAESARGYVRGDPERRGKGAGSRGKERTGARKSRAEVAGGRIVMVMSVPGGLGGRREGGTG